MTFELRGIPDFIGHMIGLASLMIASFVVWYYATTHNKGLPYIFNVLGIILGIIGFLLMLWAGARKVNLPRGLISAFNDDDTSNQVTGMPWPTTWIMGIVYVVIGMFLQLIFVFLTS